MDKIKAFILQLNNYGIPLPFLRDPKTASPSVTLTMMIISFSVVLLGLAGKMAKVLDIDLQQALYFFMICSGLYLGRKIANGSTSVESDKNNVTNESGK